MKIAFVGVGFVADYYMTTLANHPELELVGVFDRSAARLEQFCNFYGATAYPSLDALMEDPTVQIVVNLTTPESHFDVSRRALEAGKHVYSEKPLAMRFEDAKALVDLAADRSLCLAAAPANALGEAHARTAEALAHGSIGMPRLIYAEMEDGAVFREKWQDWRSRSGAVWPGVHEFEIGCTLEHAGYALSWLVSLFGPVESLGAFSAVAFPDKGPGTQAITMAPDFSVGCLRFRSGTVARLTSGLAARKDRSLTVFGDTGTLTVRDLWDHFSAVHVEGAGGPRQIMLKLVQRLEARWKRFLPWKPTPGRSIAQRRSGKLALPGYPSQIDFAAGIAAQAEALRRGEQPFFSGAVALHITEIALALNNAGAGAPTYQLRTTF